MSVSTVAKPHVASFHPLFPTELCSRQTPLWSPHSPLFPILSSHDHDLGATCQEASHRPSDVQTWRLLGPS